MKLDKKQLEKLNREYGKLKKDDKVISLKEIKKAIENIIQMHEELEEMLTQQRSFLGIIDGENCEGGSCEIEQTSELYDLYDELEDMVIDGEFYKSFYMIKEI